MPFPKCESSLSAILERAENVPDKYFLSAKACLGILRRAEARKKILPQRLKEALEIQAGLRENDTDISSDEPQMFNEVASTLRAGAGAPKHLSDMLGRLVCTEDAISCDVYNGNVDDKVAPTVTTATGSTNGSGPKVLHGEEKEVICLNDQGGVSMGISMDKVNTLRAEAHGNIPIVLGFSTQASIADNAPVLEDKTPPMRTTTRLGVCLPPEEQEQDTEEKTVSDTEKNKDAVKVFDIQHRSDVIREYEDEVPTLTARMGTGGHNVPLVYGICSQNSNAMKSPNPNSGIYKAKTTRTLDTNGGNPNCNQGGMVIAYAIAGNTIDRKLENGGNGKGVLEEKSYTLNTIDRHAVAL